MKKWLNYLISTISFCISYTIVKYLFSKNIDYKLVIVTTSLYSILYIAIDLIRNKLIKKK